MGPALQGFLVEKRRPYSYCPLFHLNVRKLFCWAEHSRLGCLLWRCCPLSPGFHHLRSKVGRPYLYPCKQPVPFSLKAPLSSSWF